MDISSMYNLYCPLQSFVMRKLLPLLLLSGYSAFAQHPVISSISSVAPQAGSTFTVTGTGYDASPSNNTVYIGGAKASLSSVSATSLHVVMPNGATHGPLTVVNTSNGLSGSSAQSLLPSYNNTGYDATIINLQGKVDFAAGTNLLRMAIGDLDGDGKSDIVVVDSANDNIQILRNTGTAGVVNASTFAPAFSLTVQNAPCAVALGDIDGDGKLDIAVTNSLSTSISVFRNTSTSGSLSASSFATRVDITGTNAVPSSISLTDWDMDGKADVTVACQNANIINVFRSNCTAGNITAALFDPKVNFTPGTGPVAIVGTDIDGDGKPDMCILNNASNNVTVLRNTATAGSIATGSFAAAVVFSTAIAPSTLAVADIDGDGHTDLIATNNTSNTFSILRNTSTTGTVSFAGKVDFIAGSGPFGVAIGDMNGDGKADVVVSNNNANTISAYRNTATSGSIGTSSFASAITATAVASPRAISIADIDNDGIADIITTNASGIVSVFRNNPIADITGTFNVCVGNTTTLSNATAGGVWASSHTAVATVNTTGLVTGVSPGTATISYTVSSVTTTKIVTVSPLPDAGTLSGTLTVCAGAATTLSSTASGGSWSSSASTVGTVNATGIVTGVSAGTTAISYTVTNSCSSATVSSVVTVNPLANPGTISGSLAICAGSSTTLSSSQPAGTWSSGTTGIGTISTAGVADGIAAGTTTISYGVTNGCGTQFATSVLTVNAVPAPITGGSNVCVGSVLALSSATAGGTWSSGNTAIATVSATGAVTGVSPGVVLISYTNAGCTTASTITVNLVPFAGTLSGATTFCTGSTITISSTASGGTWSATTTSVATVNATTGVVTGIAAGTTAISYTLTNGCGTATASAVVTVEALPVAGTISGPVSVCASGSNITLTSSTTSGVWTSGNTLAATISSSGVITSVDPGTATITYTVTNMCGTDVATTIITVNPLPAVIAGPSAVCVGTTINLTNATGGGSWSSAHATASVDATGTVSGIAAGTARISYTLVVGCARSMVVTVYAAPSAITGMPIVCEGATTTLLNSVSGGTWVSGNTSVATVGSSNGIVTGVASGTARITYFRPVTGCTVFTTVTVNAMPVAISGDSVLCIGATVTLSTTPVGGTWLSSNITRATVGIGTGIVTGVSAGTVQITYTGTGGCRRIKTVTINQAPQDISGPLSLCQGSTSTLSNIIPFGVWISSNTTVGAISGTGAIAGLAAGTSTISYVLSNGCYRSVVVTVNPTPTSVTGASSLCVAATATYTGLPVGGTWVSSDAGRATIVAGTGIATGIAQGTAAISYILPTGCRLHRVVTINPIPVGISGPAVTCVGSTTLLSSSPVTGTWSSSTPSVATVASVAGVVTGVAAGTAVITYMLPGTGCNRTIVATINPLPTPIAGASTVCAGSSVTLSATPTGGSWSSGTTAVANIGFTSGVVNALTTGTTVISYRTAAGCLGTRVLTVNPLANAGVILGTPTFCQGTTVTLTATSAGGVWATTNGKVSVSSTGAASGIMAGIDTVSYTVTNSCNTSVTRYVVTVNPLPIVGTISGQDTFCLGANGTLSNASIGGTWSSDNVGVITISAGVATPISLGTATISYLLTNSCGTSVATINIAVVSPIDAGTISGPDTVCYANTITLTGSVPGGQWSSSSPYVSVGSASGTVTGLAPGVAAIRHVVSNECSTDTAYYNVYVRYSIDCPTAINDLQSVRSINIYPVPTTSSFTIESPVSGNVTMCEVNGKIIANWQVNSGKNNVVMPHTAAPGIYFVRFVATDGIATFQRIIYQP